MEIQRSNLSRVSSAWLRDGMKNLLEWTMEAWLAIDFNRMPCPVHLNLLARFITYGIIFLSYNKTASTAKPSAKQYFVS
jgi:hypothetical protein